MDCCNYMQYRHPYYGPQFYENGLYGRDYYGHPYQSYYANSHYYSQQWPCAAPFAGIKSARYYIYVTNSKT